MISETEFAELGNSLTEGFFTDNVVLVLARTQRLNALKEFDKTTLKEAIKLLDNILHGEKWFEKRKIDAKAAETALALKRAVFAVPNITIPDEFVDYINTLKETLNNLLTTGKVDNKKIQEVRKFFYSYAKALSAESKSIIEKSSEPIGGALCVP